MENNNEDKRDPRSINLEKGREVRRQKVAELRKEGRKLDYNTKKKKYERENEHLKEMIKEMRAGRKVNKPMRIPNDKALEKRMIKDLLWLMNEYKDGIMSPHDVSTADFLHCVKIINSMKGFNYSDRNTNNKKEDLTNIKIDLEL